MATETKHQDTSSFQTVLAEERGGFDFSNGVRYVVNLKSIPFSVILTEDVSFIINPYTSFFLP